MPHMPRHATIRLVAMEWAVVLGLSLTPRAVTFVQVVGLKVISEVPALQTLTRNPTNRVEDREEAAEGDQEDAVRRRLGWTEAERPRRAFR
ncbi:hypothetical protein HDK77DRAFT_446538 [Phyllosticta capitalensis]